MKKSYHSMVVPTTLAKTARRRWPPTGAEAVGAPEVSDVVKEVLPAGLLSCGLLLLAGRWTQRRPDRSGRVNALGSSPGGTGALRSA